MRLIPKLPCNRFPFGKHLENEILVNQNIVQNVMNVVNDLG